MDLYIQVHAWSYVIIHRSMTAPMDLYIQAHAWSYIIIHRSMTASMDPWTYTYRPMHGAT